MNAIKTKHNLDFEAVPWPRNPFIIVFRVGTCHGQYDMDDKQLRLISVINESQGNGHLEDVFEWFEYASKVNELDFIICEFFNERFKRHCIEKRGFRELPGTNDLIKSYGCIR